MYGYQQQFQMGNVTKKDPKIFDKNNFTNTGILYWQQSTLEQIAKLSGPLAKANEFQIHYWALVVRFKFTDSSIIDVALPTAIFNYEQEVNPAHIDFELKDVNAVSKMIQPIHNMVSNQLLPKLQEVFKDSEHYKIEYLSVPLNTMHRHPTGVASFSGTDLRKDHEKDTGIVFPLKTGKETPSFSSIIYNNPVKLIHTEYRIATGSVEDKEGIRYQKGRCATFIKDTITEPSMAERFLGHKPTNKSYLVDKTNIADIHPLLDILNEIEYTPNTQFIKEENLKKKTYQVGFTNQKDAKKDTKKGTKIADIKENPTVGPTLIYDQETRDLVKQIANLTIHSYAILESMPAPQLRAHVLPIEQYYYQDGENITVTDYVSLSRKELIDLAIEIQNLVVEEIEEMMESPTGNLPEGAENRDSREYQVRILMSYGAPKADLDKADDATVKRWYTELTLYDEVF